MALTTPTTIADAAGMQPDLTKPRIGLPEAVLLIVAAFWIGMIVTLFLAIPTIFGGLPHDRAQAGRIAASVFSKADGIRLALSLLAMVAGVGVCRRRRGSRGRFVFAVLPALAAFSVAVGVGYIAPEIGLAQARGVTQTAAFQRLHRAGTGLFMLEGAIAVAILIATCMPTSGRGGGPAQKLPV